MKTFFKKMSASAIATLVLFSVAVPPASAATSEEIKIQIEAMMAQIARLGSNAGTTDTSSSQTVAVPAGKAGGAVAKFATFTQTEKQVHPDDRIRLLEGKVHAVPHARNLNKVVFYLSPNAAAREQAPWEVFDDMDLIVNGYHVRSVAVDDEDSWQLVGTKDGSPIYAVTVYEGNIVLPAKVAPRFAVEMELQTGETGDAWRVWVPKNGITTWSAKTKHVSYGPSRVLTYTISESSETAVTAELTPAATPVAKAPRIIGVQYGTKTSAAAVKVSFMMPVSKDLLATSGQAVKIGTVAWGDAAASAPIMKVATSTDVRTAVSHVYKKPGTYTVTLTSLEGTAVSETVTVKRTGTSSSSQPASVVKGISTDDVTTQLAAIVEALKAVLAAW